VAHIDELADRSELHELAYRYAAAVDARDEAAFLDVFSDDACLSTYGPGATEPFAVQTGRAELRLIPEMMRDRFAATMHSMTNHLVSIDGDRASGTVYCTARHLFENPMGGMDLVVVIRYEDVYRREQGTWRIADRQIHFLWTETHATLSAAQSIMA
jgi:ketosteroid isomerase-like protein